MAQRAAARPLRTPVAFMLRFHPKGVYTQGATRCAAEVARRNATPGDGSPRLRGPFRKGWKMEEQARTREQYRQWREHTWQALAEVQLLVCAICGRRGDIFDHDHETGLVRGLLCRGCNAIEGGPGGDHPNHVRYREHPPAASLPVPIRYCAPPPEPSEEGIERDAGTHASRVLALLQASSYSLTVKQMGRALQTTPGVLRSVLARLRRAGHVERTMGGWTAVTVEEGL